MTLLAACVSVLQSTCGIRLLWQRGTVHAPRQQGNPSRVLFVQLSVGCLIAILGAGCMPLLTEWYMTVNAETSNGH